MLHTAYYSALHNILAHQSRWLNLLNTFRERYNCDVGLSDHSGTIYPSLAAATLGATYVEVHTVFKQCFGPDVSSSVTLDELSQIVEGSNFIHQCISCDYSKI